MADEVEVTIEDQFLVFARLFDPKRSGETITLYRSDYWMRQAHVLDDRNVTMVDTGNLFFGKFSKTEINYKEWMEFVQDLCKLKDLDEELILNRLTVCGKPGETAVVVPEFRTYFKTWESKSEEYCNATYDGFLCWPPTLSGERVAQNCPKEHFSDPAQFAVRKCGDDGKWQGRYTNDTSPIGWTNYTPCFPPVVQFLFNKLHVDGDAQYKFKIADTTRTIEIVGFTVSLISLIMSLIILTKFRSLHNLRTSIHKNLFSAMSAQVVARLIMYVDQAMMRRGAGTATYTGTSAIENLPYLCVLMYVSLEYLICVMFLWMLCEGFYLNTIVTNNVLRDNNKCYKYFVVLGWITPLFFTAAWAIIAGIHYAQQTASSGCWYGYNFQPYFWVIQGPRLAVILINFVFLLNIMRVLVLKLREDTTSDIIKARKAVKAAMVLLPLLGITNILSMFEGPVSGPVWHFATWSYITHSLRSFQGAVLAWLYCLGTAENVTYTSKDLTTGFVAFGGIIINYSLKVRVIVAKELNNRLAIFRYRHPQLASCLGIARRRPIRRFPRHPPGDPLAPLRGNEIHMRQLRHYRSLQQPVEVVPSVSETNLGEVTVEPDNNQKRRLRHFRAQQPFDIVPKVSDTNLEDDNVERIRADLLMRQLRLFRAQQILDEAPKVSKTNLEEDAVEMKPADTKKKYVCVSRPLNPNDDSDSSSSEKRDDDEDSAEPHRASVVHFCETTETFEIPRDSDGDNSMRYPGTPRWMRSKRSSDDDDKPYIRKTKP